MYPPHDENCSIPHEQSPTLSQLSSEADRWPKGLRDVFTVPLDGTPFNMQFVKISLNRAGDGDSLRVFYSSKAALGGTDGCDIFQRGFYRDGLKRVV